jgi:hypothetical protein
MRANAESRFHEIESGLPAEETLDYYFLFVFSGTVASTCLLHMNAWEQMTPAGLDEFGQLILADNRFWSKDLNAVALLSVIPAMNRTRNADHPVDAPASDMLFATFAATAVALDHWPVSRSNKRRRRRYNHSADRTVTRKIECEARAQSYL